MHNITIKVIIKGTEIIPASSEDAGKLKLFNMGTKKVIQLDDNWTIVTEDGMPSAHFEHDIAVVNGKPEILSTFKYIEEALAKKK